MIVDLHAHYPMHLVPDAQGTTLRLLTSPPTQARRRDRLRARLVALASRFANYETFLSGPGVTVPLMRAGGVGVALSVLYSPFDEMDLTKWQRGAPPDPRYFPNLLRQLELVEHDVAENFAADATVAHDRAELDAALAADRTALVHCVEGGFHLGATPEAMDEHVTELARRGVAYITPAHLFWRGVATNAPALPFLPDWAYRLLFPQPPIGLTDLGEAAVRAMVRERVLVDITHMSPRSIEETFALLDRLDPDRRVPVVASHIACRFGRREYNLSDEAIARAAERGGALGVIFCEHYLTEGLRRRGTRSFEQAVEVMARHIDRIHAVTGSHDHAAIGSDLDGFIKPTVRGLEHMGRMRALEAALTERYGAETAARICSENALRVLRAGWRQHARGAGSSL